MIGNNGERKACEKEGDEKERELGGGGGREYNAVFTRSPPKKHALPTLPYLHFLALEENVAR